MNAYGGISREMKVNGGRWRNTKGNEGRVKGKEESRMSGLKADGVQIKGNEGI